MDYALLAATALGAIGLYLMLPRDRAPLVGLGALLGVLGLAGFFLYLVRLTASAQATTAPSGASAGPPVYFYIFSAIMIASAVAVICQPRPVYAALYFVLLTLAGAGLFVLLQAEFMAIVLIIIYAGAILVTYVFVIMLASQGSVGGSAVAPSYDRRSAEPFISVLVSFVLVGAILQVLLPVNGRTLATPAAPEQMMLESLGMAPVPAPAGPATNTSPAATTAPVLSAAIPEGPSNVQLLGASLYSRYSLSLELAGVLLTVALIGAVVIARKGTPAQHTLGTGNIPSE
ncbi:MAG TPA: NADH-quinone oxidoreductase subunit J [Phycisphaerae bacterium]|jgi:NADH-quinone oxidoreductase subunit J|nr:NADH-quinone oxidoreductase subunit J [Phycisphaerae bacterium]